MASCAARFVLSDRRGMPLSEYSCNLDAGHIGPHTMSNAGVSWTPTSPPLVVTDAMHGG